MRTLGELEQLAGIGQSHDERLAFWIKFTKCADPIAAGVAELKRMIGGAA